MKTYLCGGINGLSDADCRNWRELAKAQLVTETLDPMRRDYRGKEAESVDAIVEGDLDDIWRSDYVLVNATRPSWGTAMELRYAFERGKTIVAFVGIDAALSPTGVEWQPFPSHISPWLRYHAIVVATLGAAVAYINGDAVARRSRPQTLDVSPEAILKALGEGYRD